MTSILPYEQQHPDDPVQEQAKVVLSEILQEISEIEYLASRIVKNQELVVGDNTIDHGLDRELRGWWIVRRRGLASGAEPEFDKQDDNETPESTLVLEVNTARTVDIVVY